MTRAETSLIRALSHCPGSQLWISSSDSRRFPSSNNYQEQESEKWVGEWMKKRGNRDEIVLATKFTNGYRNDVPIRLNYGGNSSKSLHISVEESLKKLQTSYIDLVCTPYQQNGCSSVPTLLVVCPLVGLQHTNPRGHAVS